ncbi:RNA1 polyprotein [Rhizoctonia solani]|uniref:RNA1 polyprotein n=1 Tax=Rhizoctonia solani TaxID=456999 RepID=A0A0K6FXW1_9AGAM|nr:RNA1 polyprotein [Rhizoctonia solani]
MSAELRENILKDHQQLSLVSLADAADALAKAAVTLAAAARATVVAFSTETLVSPVIEETQGINIGKGSNDIHKLISDAEGLASTRLGLDEEAVDSTNKAVSLSTDIDFQKQNSERVNQPYHLLVDTEADVLLFVCALIDKRRKAICYMPCGTNPLKTYKQLIENVTETPVHMLTSTSSKQDQCYTDFLENDGSVLLVPESLSPEFNIEGDNSWVIHVGWPVSETQYTVQRKNHRAHNNVLVAYSGDQSLYASGDRIVELAEPWPQDNTSFRASVSILRPLYEVVLSEISLDMKSRVYQYWIQFHAIHGPRRVEAWTTSMMVKRANQYILEVLHWSGPHTGGDDIPLPEVSSGFVTQNELQSAIQEGLLRVEEEDSDPNESPPAAAPGPQPTLTQPEFQLVTGHTYFALEEDFDAIPLICFISSKYDKVICFLEGHGALRHYQRLFAQITGRHVITPTVSNNQANEAIEEAVARLLSATPPTILLLAYTTTNLPSALTTGSIDCCLYWGLNSPLKQGTGTVASVLAPMRNKTMLVLMSDKGVVRELYINRVYGVGAIPRQSLSAEDAARRANQYAARVLLHGDSADGTDILNNACLGNIRVEQLSTLAHAADCLATAAGALSEAARAVAGSFTSEPLSEAELEDSEDTTAIKNLVSKDSELSAEPPLNLILLNPVPDPIAITGNSELEQVGGEQAKLIEELLLEDSTSRSENNEQEVNELDKDEDSSFCTAEVLDEQMEDFYKSSETGDVNSHEELASEIGKADPDDSVTLSEAEQPIDSENLIHPEKSYRILVEDEFDVLLSVCALIGKDQRVICYMPCGTSPLTFYKQLIESVTGTYAFFPERTGAAKRDAAYKKSLESNNSVALVPGTLALNVELEGSNTWVIHVGWPPNREKYATQIKSHQAAHNVIIAFTGDLELYPSRTPLMAQTQTWPKYAELTTSANDLRQTYELELAAIRDDVKEKIYADWIQSHGVYGPRYVKTWDATALVRQANHHLLHVLKYQHKSLESGTPEESLLPEVSPGFVGQNLLESAVQSGVLHAKHDSGLNHISSLAQVDLKSPIPTISEVGTSTRSALVAGYSGDKANAQGTRPRTENLTEEPDFKLKSGHTYFTTEEDFDAMPLICFLAGKYDKTVCFLEGQGSLRHYQKLFSKILQSKFLVVAPEATNSDQANSEAASLFIKSSIPSMLLLTYSTTNLPYALRENRIGCCIYWGFHLPLKQAKKHRDQTICSSTIMIISKTQQSELKRQSTDVTEHPSTRTLLDLGPKSLLWPMRDTTTSVLMSEEATVKGLYVNRIYGLGTVSRTERSAEEVIRMANRYSAKILLRGLLEDGSENFPPVAGRLPVPRTVVERFSLQPAVSAGLVSIG